MILSGNISIFFLVINSPVPVCHTGAERFFMPQLSFVSLCFRQSPALLFVSRAYGRVWYSFQLLQLLVVEKKIHFLRFHHLYVRVYTSISQCVEKKRMEYTTFDSEYFTISKRTGQPIYISKSTQLAIFTIEQKVYWAE